MASWLKGIEERTVAAYKERGLRAVPFDLKPSDGETSDGCCCALGALHADRQSYGDIARAENASLNEVMDFAYGFDAALVSALREPCTVAGRAGYRTGQAVIDAGLRK